MRGLKGSWRKQQSFEEMSKFELGWLIRTALQHALKEQEKLLKNEHVADLLPVIKKIAHFVLELEEWYSNKYHLNDRCKKFLAQAKIIEAASDRISERLWQYISSKSQSSLSKNTRPPETDGGQQGPLSETTPGSV